MNSRFSRAKKVGIAAAVVASVLFTGAMVADARVKASGAETFSVANAPSRPVVIVLGARVYANGNPSAALEDRLHCALDLVRSGRARDVIVSGDHGRRDYDEVNAMRAWLVARGVASERVYLDHAGFRTLDTMVRAREVFAVRSALVCTQRFHLARSLWLARAQGIDAAGVVADRRIYPARRFDATREFLARVKAVLDTEVLGTAPRFLGPRVPVGSDAAQTHDR